MSVAQQINVEKNIYDQIFWLHGTAAKEIQLIRLLIKYAKSWELPIIKDKIVIYVSFKYEGKW